MNLSGGALGAGARAGERARHRVAAHRHQPVTLAVVGGRRSWVLVAAAVVFTALAVGAAFDALPWDRPITDAVVDARTDGWNAVARRVSFLGSTPVVLSLAAVVAAFAWRRCPRLAVAVVVLVLARPLIEFTLKELIDRPRPDGDRMVRGRGPAFPSGHPFAFALTWGLVPIVAALYTRRRAVALAIGAVVWVMAVLVAASRVWLGVHWASDVVGGLLLGVLGVAAAEAVVRERGCGCPSPVGSAPGDLGGNCRDT